MIIFHLHHTTPRSNTKIQIRIFLSVTVKVVWRSWPSQNHIRLTSTKQVKAIYHLAAKRFKARRIIYLMSTLKVSNSWLIQRLKMYESTFRSYQRQTERLRETILTCCKTEKMWARHLAHQRIHKKSIINQCRSFNWAAKSSVWRVSST